MRATLALCLALAAAGAQAQTIVLDAMKDGKNIGTFTFTRKKVGTHLVITYVVDVKDGAQTAKLRALNTYDAKGYPKSKGLVATANGTDAKVDAKFTGMKAKLTITAQGKTQTRDLTAPVQTPLTDASVWWFITTKPKVGATVKYQTLNLFAGSWIVPTTKYIGPGTVQIKGKGVKGHQMETDQGQGNKSVIWVDDKGLPLILEQSGIKFIRR